MSYEEVSDIVRPAVEAYADDRVEEAASEFRKLHTSIRRDPEAIRDASRDPLAGKAYSMYVLILAHYTNYDIDYLQQVTSIGYLVLSLYNHRTGATRQGLFSDRFLLLKNGSNALKYTLLSVFPSDEPVDFLSPHHNDLRERVEKEFESMVAHDLSKIQQNASDNEIIAEEVEKFNEQINRGYFGKTKNTQDVISDGKEYHSDTVEYLKDRVLDKNNIDF